LFEQGNLQEALRYQLRALEIFQRLAHGSAGEVRTLKALADVSRLLGRPKESLQYFSKGIESLEVQASMLGGSQESKQLFRAIYNPIYSAFIDLLINQGMTEMALHILERSRAQGLLSMLSERDLVLDSDVPEDLEKERKLIAAEYDRTLRSIVEIKPGEEQGNLDILLLKLKKLLKRNEEIRDHVRRAAPELATLRYPMPLDFHGIVNTLDQNTTIIAYSINLDTVNLLAVNSEGLSKAYRLPITFTELKQKVRLLRDLVYAGSMRGSIDRSVATEEIAAHLYEALIRPVDKMIEVSDRVLIIPDGPLHLLPWSTLVRKTPDDPGIEVNQTKQFMIEWKPIHVSVSATMFRQSKIARLDKNEMKSNLYAFGDPVYPPRLREPAPEESMLDRYVRSAKSRGFNFEPLPATSIEVKQIASLYPEASHTYLGIHATEEQVKSLPRDPYIVHFATHATLDQRFPLNSAVVLSIPETPIEGRDNGLLQAWEIFERIRFDADLVVLSACDSGLGKEMGGEGLIGLTRAFQYAGARSVMASLWKISDRTTAELMVRFYRHLKEGKPKDEALRAAQMELIRGPIQITNEKGEVEEIDASAPYYWAAFQIYGDWQ
jgi:CHAT domain-containing protein